MLRLCGLAESGPDCLMPAWTVVDSEPRMMLPIKKTGSWCRRIMAGMLVAGLCRGLWLAVMVKSLRMVAVCGVG